MATQGDVSRSLGDECGEQWVARTQLIFRVGRAHLHRRTWEALATRGVTESTSASVAMASVLELRAKFRLIKPLAHTTIQPARVGGRWKGF